MTNAINIISSHQPIGQGIGNNGAIMPVTIDRVWYRFFQDLQNNISTGNWGAGVVNAIGPGLSLNQGTLAANPEWLAGTVTSIGPGLSLLSNGELIATSQTSLIFQGGLSQAGGTVVSQFQPGSTVYAIGQDLTITPDGTLASVALGTLVAGGSFDTGTVAAVPSPLISRPAAASFPTWFNQNGATLTDNSYGPLTVSVTATAGSNLVAALQTIASGNWTYTAVIDRLGFPHTYVSPCMILNDGTKSASIGVEGSDTGTSTQTFALKIYTWSNGTTPTSVFSQTVNRDGPLWLRVHYDGTHHVWSFSIDGFDFITALTQTPYLTPTQAGFGANIQDTQSTAYPVGAKLYNWLQT